MQFIFNEEREKLLHESIGGKARNLLRLQDAGVPVPPWGVIPPAPDDVLFRAAHMKGPAVKGFLEKIEIPDAFIKEILKHFDANDTFAVRSSASMEDGADFSFAGQFSSFLYVPPSGLAEAIMKVWLSGFSERIMTYRSTHGIGELPQLAVIVQRMVDAEVSGVAFGIDPSTGNRRTFVVTAVYGLGEGIVSGELLADTYRVMDGEITSEIAHKTEMLKRAEGEGLIKTPVGANLQDKPALSREQILTIAGLVELLRQHLIKPQDVEFAVERGKLWLLQTRPVTNLHRLHDPHGDRIVWDNSNIIESYPDLTSPLTFSFIIDVYEAVYRQFCALMGVNAREIENNGNVFAHMLGLLNGRVYYNLLSWYKTLALLPGYSLNAEFMEKMMGVKERFILTDLPKRTRLQEKLRVGNMVLVMLRNLITLPKQRRIFQAHLDSEIKRLQRMDFDSLRPEELLRLYKELENTLVKKWKAPLVNDFFAMIYFGVLQKIAAGVGNSRLHNDLLCGAKDIISTEPIRLIRHIVKRIAADKSALQFFMTHEEDEVWECLEKGDYTEIKKAVDEYIGRFGERCVGELKLETVTYTQQPQSLIRIIKTFLSQHEIMEAPAAGTENELRARAEQEMAAALKGRPIRRLVFGHVLRNARSLVSQRENLRYERTRAFGMVRKIFIAMGRRFYAENIIDNPRDIFYLKKEEIFDYIQGASVSPVLRKIINLRKEDYSKWEGAVMAERVTTYGMVYHGNDYSPKHAASVLTGDLKGIGCCPGVIKGRVRVLQGPDEIQSLEGDILVTSSTDPGWVILFPSASAILVERGSLLSHSAIVSREMGIPCIVGVTGLLGRLKTGDYIEMDGSTGVIKLTDEGSPGS
ncbi:MAG: PEP-utilizing enzyme [Bacteroidota bacterium]|nr:PEP-utilizing enzyme [Bacteroidota bacterium]